MIALAPNETTTDRDRNVRQTTPLHLIHAALATPVGELQLYASERGLLTIALPNESREQAERRLERAHGPLAIAEWAGAVSADDTQAMDDPSAAAFAQALAELNAYFVALTDHSGRSGAHRGFTVPLDLRGTAFQRQAWLAVAEIPMGETRAYSEIALVIGRPAAVRAVGAANGANPIPIIIPCHRVIGADGSLTGYGGGLPLKRWLLDHEMA